jgi:hypothetical protein
MVGTIFVVFCTTILFHERWVLEKTSKGQSLVRWFGPAAAIWVLRTATFFGVIFGSLLAAGIVRPIQW